MIKFRAKRVNGGEWVKSMTISYGTIKRKMYNVFFEVEPNKWVGVIPETVCQFSEITDKNGNSIFEHDLILIHESESSYQFTVEVLFHKGMFCYKNKACGFTPLWYVSDRCECTRWMIVSTRLPIWHMLRVSPSAKSVSKKARS